MSASSNPLSRRRAACALALPAFPLTLLAATLVSPTDSTKDAVQLHAAGVHGSRWVASALLELLAAALMPLAVAAVAWGVRRRGTGLANAGIVLGVLGTVGMAAIGVRHLFVYGLARIDRSAALHVLDRVDHAAGAVVLPLMFAGPLALILLAGAAVRAGLAPRWIVAGAVVFFVSDSLPIPAAEVIQMLVGLATFGTLAARLLRAPSEARASIDPTTAQAGVVAA